MNFQRILPRKLTYLPKINGWIRWHFVLKCLLFKDILIFRGHPGFELKRYDTCVELLSQRLGTGLATQKLIHCLYLYCIQGIDENQTPLFEKSWIWTEIIPQRNEVYLYSTWTSRKRHTFQIFWPLCIFYDPSLPKLWMNMFISSCLGSQHRPNKVMAVLKQTLPFLKRIWIQYTLEI